MSDNDSDDLYEGVVVDRDQADPSDTLTGDNTEDPLDAGYSPPDRENKSWRGETVDEEIEGESLDQKLAEEEPEVGEADLEAAYEEPRAGRLIDTDYGSLEDTEKDEVAIDAGRAGSAASAEEAAVHVVDDEDPAGAGGV